MLYIIGLGLDIKDISLKGLEAVKRCKKVYLESYTTGFPYKINQLERVLGKKVALADRELVEDGKELINFAKKQNTALLVYGDPLAATTHIDLLLRAEKAKIKVAVVHAVSILNAVAEGGLQLYKFGKTASIAKWQPSFRPESFYDVIKGNLKIGAHTLLLIDIGLGVNEALSYIKEVAKKRKDTKLLQTKLIVCSKIGTAKGVVKIGKPEALLKKSFSLPACIVVPARLHFMEAEALKRFK